MTTGIRRFAACVTVFAALAALAAPPLAHAGESTVEDGWEAAGPLEPRSLVADDDGAVALGRTGEVVLVDASGTERWRRTIVADASSGPAALGEDLVAVIVQDLGLIGFDRASSKSRWHHDAPGADVVGVGATSTGTVVALVTDLGVLELVDGMNGDTRWSITYSSSEYINYERVWVVDDRVLLVWTDDTGSHLRAFSSDRGNLSWSHDAPGFTSMPAVHDDAVVFAENSRKDEDAHLVFGEFKSLAVDTGEALWTTPMQSRNGYWAGIATAAGEHGVAFVDLAGRVAVVNPATGRVRWRWTTRRFQYDAEPAVLGDVFAMTTYGTGLLLAGMPDGRPISIDAIEPGQTSMTIEGSAAAGSRLYLLVHWPWGDAEIWMLHDGSA